MPELRARLVVLVALLATFGFSLPAAARADGDPCATLAAEERDSGIGGTGLGDPDSGIGGTGLDDPDSGIGGTGFGDADRGTGVTGFGDADRGTGGTGFGDPDSGIGGTGLLGTITGVTGSICVNAREVRFADVVAVSVNGEAASTADLSVGHVVWVVADAQAEGLVAQSVAVLNALVGRVDAVDRAAGRLRIAGEDVELLENAPVLEGLGGRAALAAGTRVAVSGLRRTDGSIVASRIDAAGAQADRSSLLELGPLLGRTPEVTRVVAQGYAAPAAGGARLAGLRIEIPGERPEPNARVRVEGRLRAGALVADRWLPDRSALPEPIERPEPPELPEPAPEPPDDRAPEPRPVPPSIPVPPSVPVPPSIRPAPVERPEIPDRPERTERPERIERPEPVERPEVIRGF